MKKSLIKTSSLGMATVAALSLAVAPLAASPVNFATASAQEAVDLPLKEGVYETNSVIITHFEIEGDNLFFYFNEPAEDLGKDTFKVLFPKLQELATTNTSPTEAYVLADDMSEEEVDKAREEFADGSIVIQRNNDRNDLSEKYFQVLNLKNALGENSDGSYSVFIHGVAENFILFRLQQKDDDTLVDVNRNIEFKRVEIEPKAE